MGLGKLRIQLINNEKSRYKYLVKRKKSLENAAKDLSTLCEIDVGMIIYAPAQGMHSDQPIAIWPPDQQILSGLIDSYKGRRSCHDGTLFDLFKDKTKKVDDELKKKLQEEMKRLHGGMMAKIDDVRRRINLMKGSTSLLSCNYSVDRESQVFGPNMWRYDKQLPNFVYSSGLGSVLII